MPLNSHIMKGAWVLQKNWIVGAVLVSAAVGGYYQFSDRSAQNAEAARAEAARIEALLNPKNFDVEALSDLVRAIPANDNMKLLVLKAIESAEKNPELAELAVSQVRMLLAAQEPAKP